MAESWQQNPHQWCFLPRPSELAALLAAKSISGVGIQFGVRRVGQSTEKWFRACYLKFRFIRRINGGGFNFSALARACA